MNDRRVRIPRSARRRGVFTYAKLIKRLLPHPTTGFDFEGALLKPGSTIQKADLWPTADHPRTPLLLEYAGEDMPGWGHRRSPGTYILWLWHEAAWIEIARTRAESSAWCAVLGPVAERVIREGYSPGSTDTSTSVHLIMAAIEEELSRLTTTDQRSLLSLLHDRLAARSVSPTCLGPTPEAEFRDRLAFKHEPDFRRNMKQGSRFAGGIIIGQKEAERRQSSRAGSLALPKKAEAEKTLDRREKTA